MASDNNSFDIIVVGGGTAGCVIASRLCEVKPSLSIAIVEQGLDERQNPLVVSPQGAPRLTATDVVSKYTTVPQTSLNGRTIPNYAGKMLSGSSGVNYGAWMRGHASDYDVWAKESGDFRWSYEGLLPYFRLHEHYHDPKADRKHHGFNGPIHTTSVSNREYPLGKQVYHGFVQAGYNYNPDFHNGDNIGLGGWTENWHHGARQPAGAAYDLSNVSIVTDAQVHRIIISDDGLEKTATGVQLVDGRQYSATKEVIVCCGAHKTPQLLMLSGIGPADELTKFGIKQVVDSPDVGRNFFDHLSMFQNWKLRNPEKGLSLGHAKFNKPEYAEGNPMEWAVGNTTGMASLMAALEKDGESVGTGHSLIDTPRSHTGSVVAYVVFLTESSDLVLDGTHISSVTLLFLPTSRGTVTLRSSDPKDAPIINPSYYSTEADKTMMRHAVRRMAQVFETDEMRAVIQGETVPPGSQPLNSKSGDEEIDSRVRKCCRVIHHPAGTAAMGKVVDSELNVIGVRGLRVVDASAFPSPVSGYTQTTVYALAESAADLITNDLAKGGQ